MGVVYRGHDLLLGRDVAVKLLSKAGLGTEGRARLLREAQAVAKLNHPNIVTLYDAGEADGAPFIVMELLSGVSLYERKPANMDELVEVARQVCAALGHAHEHGIIHRDLKPENVILTGRKANGGARRAARQADGLRPRALGRLTPDDRGRAGRHGLLHAARAGDGPTTSTAVQISTRLGSCCTSWPRAGCPSPATIP